MTSLIERKQWWSPVALCMGKICICFMLASSPPAVGWDSQQVLLSLWSVELHFDQAFEVHHKMLQQVRR